jgi:hypothetical protein
LKVAPMHQHTVEGRTQNDREQSEQREVEELRDADIRLSVDHAERLSAYSLLLPTNGAIGSDHGKPLLHVCGVHRYRRRGDVRLICMTIDLGRGYECGS